jgi:DNA processing protein
MSTDTDQQENELPDPLEIANAELRGASQVASKTRKVLTTKPRCDEWFCRDLGTAPPGIAERSLPPELLAHLRLSLVSGVGPRILTALLDRFATAENVLSASSELLAMVDGVGPKLVSQIKLESRRKDIDDIVHWCQSHDTRLIARGSEGYPSMLEDLCDAPSVLYCRGEILPQDSMAVAIVGTRHATNYGLKQTEQLSYSLARAGVTIVSGLARGIDATAHEAALSAGGRTIAVLGGGLAEIYPAEHAGLAKAIAADGAVISEHPPMMKPRGPLFPQRNRIVAGLSIATLVIEAPQRSGALITARLAGEMNRDVLAIPGNVTSRASQGCNELIRDGAILVQSVDDILEVLGPMRRPVPTADGQQVHQPSELQLNEIERGVLNAVGSETTSIDEVILNSQLPAHRVMAVLSILEVRRLVRRLSGQYVVRI